MLYVFADVLRAALESDFVSAHLHHWIDLIFGFKQSGSPAEKACNLFHFLTYSGAVNMDKVSSPVSRHAYEQQIRDFGQTPQQLFSSPHPMRRVRPANIVDGGEEALLKKQMQLRQQALLHSSGNGGLKRSDSSTSSVPQLSCIDSGTDTACTMANSTLVGSLEDSVAVGGGVVGSVSSVNEESSTGILVACTSTSAVNTNERNTPSSVVSRSKRSLSSDNSLSAALTEAPALVETVGGVSVSSAKINLNLLTAMPNSFHVCVVAVSDMLLQSCGLRPLLNRQSPVDVACHSHSHTINHRSIHAITAKQQFEGATNAGCIRIGSSSDSETILATGYLDATLKVISLVDGDWKVVTAFNTDRKGSISTCATNTEDGNMLLVALYPEAKIQLWKRCKVSSNPNQLQSRSHKQSVSFSQNNTNINIEDSRKSESQVDIDRSDNDLEYTIRERQCWFPYDLSKVFSAYQFHKSGVIYAMKASTRHGVFVTACADGIVILWDLETLTGMRLVCESIESITSGRVWCIDIDEVNGDVFVAMGGFIHVFDINGRPRLSVNVAAYRNDHCASHTFQKPSESKTATAAEATATTTTYEDCKPDIYPSSCQILCVQACPIVEWAPYRGFVIGLSDGSIMLWSFGYRRKKRKQFQETAGDSVSNLTLEASNLTSRESVTCSRNSISEGNDIIAISTADRIENSENNGSVSELGASITTDYSFSCEGLVAHEVVSIEDAFGSAGVSAVCLSNDLKCLFAGSDEGTVARWTLVYQL